MWLGKMTASRVTPAQYPRVFLLLLDLIIPYLQDHAPEDIELRALGLRI
jgi:hypothetical protein